MFYQWRSPQGPEFHAGLWPERAPGGAAGHGPPVQKPPQGGTCPCPPQVLPPGTLKPHQHPLGHRSGKTFCEKRCLHHHHHPPCHTHTLALQGERFSFLWVQQILATALSHQTMRCSLGVGHRLAPMQSVFPQTRKKTDAEDSTQLIVTTARFCCPKLTLKFSHRITIRAAGRGLGSPVGLWVIQVPGQPEGKAFGPPVRRCRVEPGGCKRSSGGRPLSAGRLPPLPLGATPSLGPQWNQGQGLGQAQTLLMGGSAKH